MCGIFAFLSATKIHVENSQLMGEFLKTAHRGPDSHFYLIPEPHLFMGFHRLAINDLSKSGNQPFVHKSDKSYTVLICNGEIYNYEQLSSEHGISMRSHSDCEIIVHLYERYGFQRTIEMLDGVFACVLYDVNSGHAYAARDPIGVRALYFGTTKGSEGYSYGIASELKSLHNICDKIIQFPPGHIWSSSSNSLVKYNHVLGCVPALTHSQISIYDFHSNVEEIKINIKTKLMAAVKKRLISDRPIGCLLSGGLDSSLIASILTKFYPEGKKLKTFSVGLEGAEDLRYARLVADFIGSDHTEVVLTEDEMLTAIPDTIYQLETYDTTTIRAGTPMYLLSKYIKENDPDGTTVIYTGEGSDEASGSYLYFHNAPNECSFYNEILRLMYDLCYYDVLRCDKSIAGAGLEARVPFLDLDFLSYYLQIDPVLKMPDRENGRMEKYLLRAAFDDGTFLPDEVLWRVKEGMSDGVSSKTRGWFEIIQEHADKQMSKKQFAQLRQEYKWNPPMFKEAALFREIFNEKFPCDKKDLRAKTVPYYWLPKWSGNITEPSARVLDVYQ